MAMNCKWLAAAVAMNLALPALAAEPAAVRGPEAVGDWQEAGRRFIRQAWRLQPNPRPARNVILFVGDGMGIATITAARILEGQLRGRPGEENRLSFEDFPHVALSKTYSWDQQTADSAPTMTALITGYKSREGMLAVDHLTARNECDAAALATHALPTLLEQAAAAGKATGIVSTARLTHATPGATYAHTAMRDWEADADLPAGCGVRDIARQLIEVAPAVRRSLKVALGGGRGNFLPQGQVDPEHGAAGRRHDGRDLTQAWRATRGAGARYVWNRAGFDAVDPLRTDYLLGLFENGHMQYEADRQRDKGGEPSLTEMTDKAIRLLRKGNRGYFLMVEAGRIDHAHHAGNARRALLDAVELSNAVRKAVALTDARETLIVVTADHSHAFTIAGYPHRGNNILGVVREVPDHDGTPVDVARDKLGLPYATLGYANGPGWHDAVASGVRRPTLSDAVTGAEDYQQEATVPLKSETHGGEDVAIFARGPRAHLVHGVMEQNWVYHVMREALLPSTARRGSRPE